MISSSEGHVVSRVSILVIWVDKTDLTVGTNVLSTGAARRVLGGGERVDDVRVLVGGDLVEEWVGVEPVGFGNCVATRRGRLHPMLISSRKDIIKMTAGTNRIGGVVDEYMSYLLGGLRGD